MTFTIAKRALCITIMSLCTGSVLQAQFDFDQLLEYKEDAQRLVGGYISPAMKSLSLGLNQGWYNTAKPHKIAGIDLTFTANAMYIPNSDKNYYVDNSKLKQLQLLSGTGGTPQSGNVPTVFGAEKQPVYRADNGLEFEGPDGLDLKKNIKINAIPVPLVQLGFGLPKNTDLKIRFAPTIDLGNKGTFKFWGFGLMHDVKQHIPGITLMPFDLSAFVGYTNMKLLADLSNEVQGENQNGEFNINATTIQAIISKKIAVLTVYGGAGYNIAKSKLSANGWYDFDDDNVKDAGEVNPLALSYSASGPRATAGLRIKLAALTLHADYTLQKYKTLTVGFGLSIR